MWEPISRETAMSVIGEGVHTGLRRGSDAPESGPLWRAIRESDQAWADALEYCIDGLEVMGLAICRKTPEGVDSA